MRAPYHPKPQERAAFVADFRSIEVTAYGVGILSFETWSEGLPFIDEITYASIRQLKDGLIVSKTALPSLILSLAELVEFNRRIAMEKGIEIPTSDAYAALKAIPPQVEGLV